MPNARTSSNRTPARTRKPARQTAARASGARAKATGSSVRARAASTWTMSAPRGQRRSLPGWKDLSEGKNERTRPRRQGESFLANIPTVRVALLILALASGFTLYVGHVHATQEVYAELQQIRRENLRLHLKYNRLKGEFDQATSPTVIHRRARALGLEEGLAYGPTIFVEGP